MRWSGFLEEYPRLRNGIHTFAEVTQTPNRRPVLDTGLGFLSPVKVGPRVKHGATEIVVG